MLKLLDFITNLLKLPCQHANITFPITLKGTNITHVTCLTCGKSMEYDWDNMRIGDELYYVHENTNTCTNTHTNIKTITG